jgi:hypothetical protein
MAAVSHYYSQRRVQAVIIDNQELAAMKERQAAFYAQVQGGSCFGGLRVNRQLEFERCFEKRWLVKMPEASYWGASHRTK